MFEQEKGPETVLIDPQDYQPSPVAPDVRRDTTWRMCMPETFNLP